MTRITRPFVVAVLLAVSPLATAQEPASPARKAAKPPIYDTTADAKAQVKAATALARRDARRVLVMFGFNACGWCHQLHKLFDTDAAIREILAEEYVVAMVDIESPGAAGLLADSKAALSPDEREKGVGFPFLAVLDGAGKVVTAQRTDPLEVGDHHDPALVKAFLQKWTAPKADAHKVLADGLAKASSEDKLVFLHFGSPTCGWCHKLDAFLARPEIVSSLGRQFIDVKLDLSRMTGATEIHKKYSPDASGGIPWFVFLDPKGKPLATSDGPNGNIGYPAAPEEIAHFIGMLRKTAPKLGAAQIDEIDALLKTEGKKLEPPQASTAR